MKCHSYTSLFFTFIMTFGLAACSSTPSHVIVAPDLMTIPAIYHQGKHAQLNVVDMRTANHIVQVLRKGEAATLLSAQARLEDIIKVNLTEHWKKQSLQIQSNASNTINVSIEKAVISVEQQTMEYKVQTEIVVKVTVNNGEQTLTTTFNNRGNSDGPLQADIAVLERNFNQRLAKLLSQILANEKIAKFLT